MEQVDAIVAVLRRVGAAHDRTPSQVALAWTIAKGTVPIPGRQEPRPGRGERRRPRLAPHRRRGRRARRGRPLRQARHPAADLAARLIGTAVPYRLDCLEQSAESGGRDRPRHAAAQDQGRTGRRHADPAARRDDRLPCRARLGRDEHDRGGAPGGGLPRRPGAPLPEQGRPRAGRHRPPPGPAPRRVQRRLRAAPAGPPHPGRGRRAAVVGVHGTVVLRVARAGRGRPDVTHPARAVRRGGAPLRRAHDRPLPRALPGDVRRPRVRGPRDAPHLQRARRPGPRPDRGRLRDPARRGPAAFNVLTAPFVSPQGGATP